MRSTPDGATWSEFACIHSSLWSDAPAQGNALTEIGAVARIGVRCVRPLRQRIEEVEGVPHDLVCSRRWVPAANDAPRLQPLALRSLPRVEERVPEDPAKVEDRAADTVRAGNEMFMPVVALAPDPARRTERGRRRRHAAIGRAFGKQGPVGRDRTIEGIRGRRTSRSGVPKENIPVRAPERSIPPCRLAVRRSRCSERCCNTRRSAAHRPSGGLSRR